MSAGWHFSHRKIIGQRDGPARGSNRDISRPRFGISSNSDVSRYLRGIIHNEAVDRYSGAKAYIVGAAEKGTNDGDIESLPLIDPAGVNRRYGGRYLRDCEAIFQSSHAARGGDRDISHPRGSGNTNSNVSGYLGGTTHDKAARGYP